MGTDSNATALRSALEQYGVKLDHLRAVPGASGTALILLQPNGENSIVIVGGANQEGWHLDESAMEVSGGQGCLVARV